MSHRDLYKEVTDNGSYRITYSDIAKCSSDKSAATIASEIYYNIPNGFSSAGMADGTKAHKVKELELSDEFVNEKRVSYMVCEGYYLCGTIDRYYVDQKLLEDFKTTPSLSSYANSRQLLTYAFLALHNKLPVDKTRYTAIDKDGRDTGIYIEQDITITDILTNYATYVLPRFNMIKNKIEELKKQYV